MSKERISALCFASADSMHRHKLVVVGKSARPRALKNHMHILPVHLLPLLSERERKNRLFEKSRNSHHY